jgi:hypothetical protein
MGNGCIIQFGQASKLPAELISFSIEFKNAGEIRRFFRHPMAIQYARQNRHFFDYLIAACHHAA